jgi:tRNA modification GTPase
MGAASGQAFVDARPLVRLCGPPSAGKSTLFNALLGRERSVTMHTPHTTRDVLVEPCAFPGIVSARLADTPGVDADTPASGPTDVDVWCTPWPSAPPLNVRGLVVHTKADLATSDIDGLAVSAHTGEGIDALGDAIGEALLHSQASANTSMLSARQHAAIERTDGFLVDACDLVRDDQPMAAIQSPEIVALLLRESLDQLGAITGDVSPDDVLGLVFSSFCVGK